MAPPDPTTPEPENLKQPRPINPSARKRSFPLDLDSPQLAEPALPTMPLSQAPPSIASLQGPLNNGFIPSTQPALLEPPVNIAPPDPTRPMGDYSNLFAPQIPPPPALHKDPQSAPTPMYRHTLPIKRQHSQFQEDTTRQGQLISQVAAIQAAKAAAAIQSRTFQAQAPRETSGYIAPGFQGQGSQPSGPQYGPNAIGSLQGPNVQPELVPPSTYYGPPPNLERHPEGEVTVKYQLVKGDPTLGPNGLKYSQDPLPPSHGAKRTSTRKRISTSKRKTSAQSEPSSLTTQDQGVPSTLPHPPASSPVKSPPKDPEKGKDIDNQQS